MLGLAALAIALGAGCSERSGKSRKIRKIEGVVTRIDLQNKEVTLRARNEKGIEIPEPLTGTVREDTEIMINGVNRALGDVVVGDKVVVYGYRDRDGENVKLIPTKVEVSRETSSGWQAAGKPTSAPAPSSADTGSGKGT